MSLSGRVVTSVAVISAAALLLISTRTASGQCQTNELLELTASDAATGDHFGSAPDDARFLLRAIIDDQAFLHAYREGVKPEDTDNPLVHLFTILWGWLAAAREAGVIRPVRVYQTTRNLIGILVFEPTYGSNDLADPERLASRRRELSSFVRGALAPLED